MRSTNTVFKAILGAQIVTEPVLQTLLTEVECLMRGPSLPTRMFLMTCNLSHLRTFLFSGNPSAYPQASSRKQTSTGESGSRSNFLVTYSGRDGCGNTCKPWKSEEKWRKALPNLKPNDLVLLVDDNIPRGHWNLGHVLEVNPGPDGMVCTVKVKTKDSVFIPPIQKLFLIENDLERFEEGT